jgi:hypothetical protein
MPTSSTALKCIAGTWTSAARPPSPFGLRPGDDPAEDRPRPPLRLDQSPSEGEDLPYRVELWDLGKTRVEQVLAITASGSIGYAAFYAATRELPERYITLRHKNAVVSRWNGPGH